MQEVCWVRVRRGGVERVRLYREWSGAERCVAGWGWAKRCVVCPTRAPFVSLARCWLTGACARDGSLPRDVDGDAEVAQQQAPVGSEHDVVGLGGSSRGRGSAGGGRGAAAGGRGGQRTS